MKIKQTSIFKLISLSTLITFIFGSLSFYSPAYAETACWNDASIAYDNGGSNLSPVTADGNHGPYGSQEVIDPVNLATGNYDYKHSDVFIPSRGLPLEFKRFYNNQDEYDGPFGIGWSHSYNVFLIEAADEEASYVIRRNPDGNKDKFTRNSDGSYTPPAGVFDTLTKDGQIYTITTKHGVVYRFNPSGYLASITDRNGNQITLTYDSNTAVLTSIRDTFGRQITLEYTSERKISTLSDFTGRIWQYAYLDGNLSSVTTPETADYPYGTTTNYFYQNHNLTSITDAKGNTYLNITYDDQGRVNRMLYGFGIYDFNYARNCTTLIDPGNNRVNYVLNDDGTVNKKVEYAPSLNYETRYEYNSDKLITKVIYPKGNSVEYTYADKGNLLTIKRKPNPQTSPLPNDIITTFTYEPRFNFIKASKDSRGNVTTYYYDYEEEGSGDLNGDGITAQAKGNLIKIVYPQLSGQTPETKFTYNSCGQLETVTDPNANITKYEYDSTTGDLNKTVAAYGLLNFATEMTYDCLGNVKTIKDPNENISSFDYDSHNNLISTTSAAPFNYIATYRYDANDNLIQARRGLSPQGTVPEEITTYTYDILDRLETTTDGLGNSTIFSYDANGNRSSIQDAQGNITTYSYDERNFLARVTDALGNLTTYAYDENGNLRGIKGLRGNISTYGYDDFDRLIKTTYTDGSYEEYNYDVNSNLTSKRDAGGQTITYVYDALNRLFLKTYPDNSHVFYNYDLGSRLTSVRNVNSYTTYQYDAANRIIQATCNIPPQNYDLRYEYDANSNRTKLTYPDTSYVTYEYDQLNRLTALKDQNRANIAQYTYDALSRRTQLHLANSTQTLYEYDDINRLTSINQGLSPQGTVPEFTYAYDRVGNRLCLTTPQGSHRYSYDRIYQLTHVDYPQEYSFADTTFNYDSLGNRTSTISGNTTYYTTNSLNQYTRIGSANYTYDANGNLTGDGTNTYSYDYENRLIQGTVPARGLSLTYKYDAFGRRIKKGLLPSQGTVPDAVYVYDGDQIIAEYDASGSTLLKKYIFGPGIDEVVKGLSPSASEETVPEWYYHFDGLGSVTELTNASGSVVEKYEYDAYGKTTIKDGSDNTIAESAVGNPYGFTGRQLDSESGLYYYRARHYSPTLGRFLQRDPVGYVAGINLYSYCSNNPVNFIDPFGLDKQKQKTYWDYYWETLRRQLNEPAIVSNQYFEEYWSRAFRNWNWYFDIGYSGFAPSPSHPGANVGVQIGSRGFNFYWGVGAGMGAGLTATFHPWQSLPSPGTKVNVVGRAGEGFGIKISGSISETGLSGRVGAGVGIGAGTSITATHTIRIFSWDWSERR